MKLNKTATETYNFVREVYGAGGGVTWIIVNVTLGTLRAWRARMERCVAADGHFFELYTIQIL